MPVPEYSNSGPLAFSAEPDLTKLADQSVIVTGGASGLGKAYAEAFAAAGAYVTVGDLDVAAGQHLVKDVTNNGHKAQFVECDICDWDQSVSLFEAAVQNSPHKSVDIVIANAGIVGKDELYTLEDPSGPPKKPDLRIMDVNLMGTAYTTKLALHYFRRQPVSPSRDRCLIIKASLAGFVDLPGSPQYNASKWALRGLMRNFRRTTSKEDIRINLVAPWYVRTPILAKDVQEWLEGAGVNFAEVPDAARAMLRIACDTSMNGRSIGVVPKQENPMGYLDLDHDDYRDGDFMKAWQQTVLDTSMRLVQ